MRHYSELVKLRKILAGDPYYFHQTGGPYLRQTGQTVEELSREDWEREAAHSRRVVNVHYEVVRPS